MKKIKFLFFTAVILFANYSFAGVSVYSIDRKFEAVFPSQPQLIGELGKGEYKMRGFNANDELNFIVYTASYQTEKSAIKESSVNQEINDYIKGQALVVNGAITHQSIGKLDNKVSGYFVIDYIYSGIPVKKYGAVIYYDGRFYQWAVQEVPNVSKISGLSIFNEYVNQFKILEAGHKEHLQS